MKNCANNNPLLCLIYGIMNQKRKSPDWEKANFTIPDLEKFYIGKCLKMFMKLFFEFWFQSKFLVVIVVDSLLNIPQGQRLNNNLKPQVAVFGTEVFSLLPPRE